MRHSTSMSLPSKWIIELIWNIGLAARTRYCNDVDGFSEIIGNVTYFHMPIILVLKALWFGIPNASVFLIRKTCLSTWSASNDMLADTMMMMMMMMMMMWWWWWTSSIHRLYHIINTVLCTSIAVHRYGIHFVQHATFFLENMLELTYAFLSTTVSNWWFWSFTQIVMKDGIWWYIKVTCSNFGIWWLGAKYFMKMIDN